MINPDLRTRIKQTLYFASLWAYPIISEPLNRLSRSQAMQRFSDSASPPCLRNDMLDMMGKFNVN